MWSQDTRRESERTDGSGVPTGAYRAVIGKSVVIKGEIIGLEDLTIDGRVEGRIEVRGHTLTIGQGASITADVSARVINVSGAITGQVTAIDKVTVRETGSVDGDVKAPRIAIVEGACLRGRVETQSVRTDRPAGETAATAARPEASDRLDEQDVELEIEKETEKVATGQPLAVAV